MWRMVLVVSLAMSSAVACDGGFAMGEPELPALSVFKILKPHEMKAQAAQNASAVCATGDENYTTLSAIIDEENAAHAEDLALIEAALQSNPVVDQGIVEYEAEIEGRTLVIAVVSDASEGHVFTGTLVDENGEEQEVLDGVKVADRESGTLNLHLPDSEALQVVFDEDEDGDQRIVRTAGSHEAVLEITGSDVRLVVDDVIAWWNVDDDAGVVLSGDAATGIGCFEGGADETEYCDLACTPDLIAKVTGGF